MTTLADLHNELNITQRLALYVKNQNKKYGTHYTENMTLPEDVAFLIRLNTLGKKRKHKEQIYLLRDMQAEAKINKTKSIGYKAHIKKQDKTIEELANKVQRAEKVVNQTNLRDAIIEIYEAIVHVGHPVPEKHKSTAKKYAGKAYEFMEWHQVRNMLVKIAEELTKQLKELEK